MKIVTEVNFDFCSIQVYYDLYICKQLSRHYISLGLVLQMRINDYINVLRHINTKRVIKCQNR